MDNRLSTEHSNGQTAISLRERQQSQRLRVVDLLTILAEARQASVSPQTFQLYSSELDRFQIEDIESAVRKLMYRKRAEGETAFPDLPTLSEEVRAFARVRREDEQRAADRKREGAERKHRIEHPEEYMPARDVWAEFLEKRKLMPKPAIKVPGACPHCNGVQLSAFKPADLRALADVMEALDATSAA